MSLLLSSSESVCLRVQQTPLVMVTAVLLSLTVHKLFMKSYSQTSHQSFFVYFDSFYDARTKEANTTLA